MKELNISNDIIPVGKFKSNLSSYLKELNESRNTFIITQNGKPAGVMISPKDYDEIKYKQKLIENVSKGLRDFENGNVHTTEEVKAILKKDRSKMK